ncbi:hypothetical protein EV356DRAFT_566660 [Viridothelium virens]|uniref:DUF7708 domain-containing protein n=1 Tax=Viridothelium virens TaxID=1048519 RepID=A0A6A6HAX8_VIRVR|nr:hypothetical protein EV356DRAFT_566660 [Viridothelium virens]
MAQTERLHTKKITGKDDVHRFSRELQGNTELETITRETVANIDDEDEAYLKPLFEDSNRHLRAFDTARFARDQLKKSCDHLAAKSNDKRWWTFTKSHKSASEKATEKLQEQVPNDFDSVRVVVDAVSADWTAKHTLRVCETLYAHRKAAVNHKEIAESLSRAVADVSSKAAECANWLHSTNTRDMRVMLAGIYAKVFEFFHGTIEWFIKSKISRFFDAFNSEISEKYLKAASDLNQRIQKMQNAGIIRSSAMQRSTLDGIEHLKGGNCCVERWVEVSRIFEQTYSRCRGTDARTRIYAKQLEAAGGNNNGIKEGNEKISWRSSSLEFAGHLKDHATGEDGRKLISNHQNWLLDDQILWRMQEWLRDDIDSQLLWISGPWEFQDSSSARPAALAIIAAAYQVQTLIVSYICEKPRLSERKPGMSLEKTELITLLYSLIDQLMHFNVEDEDLDLGRHRFEKLDGSRDSWSGAIALLSELLKHTPGLRFCVIDGMNLLEASDGADWCDDLLRTLLECHTSEDAHFNLLFTTAGKSRALLQRVSGRQHYDSDQYISDVERRGRDFFTS